MQEKLESDIHPWRQAYEDGKVFLYPTEAVFGLGCDPNNETAVQKILSLKNRQQNKGFILIADTYSRVFKFVKDSAIPMDRRTQIFSSWPGPVTWLLPKSAETPDWISGDSELVAVRVTAHPVVCDLCQKVESALVSTSANLSGESPIVDIEKVTNLFGNEVIKIDGELGKEARPSEIRNGLTGEIIRKG